MPDPPQRLRRQICRHDVGEDAAEQAASGAAHPHQATSCATRLKCVASLVRTRSRQAAPGFVVGRLLLAAGSARVLAAGAGSRRLRVLGLRAIFALRAGFVLMPFQWFPTQWFLSTELD